VHHPGDVRATPGRASQWEIVMSWLGSGAVRALLAVVVVAAACPAALFGGAMIGCVGQGFNSDCALNAIFISPVMLLGAGVVAGLLVRGWSGFGLVFLAVVVGMTAILFLSFGVERPVPVDPISGVIATIWFLAPVAVGYGAGRLVARLFAPRPGDRRA
jgi:hypothetical protein